MSDPNQLKPLAEQIEQRVRRDAAAVVHDAIWTAHEAARNAYQAAMAEACGTEFAHIADAILADAEIAIAEAAQKCAERKAMAAFVARMAAEAAG